jgi:aldose 1-epimerase
MTHLTHDAYGDILVPVQDRLFVPLHWPKAGAFPLVPFHNRLAGARFTHNGRRYSLSPHPAYGGDAMHGPAHRRPWDVQAVEADMLVVCLDYRADDDWPFDFRAEQRFRLRNSGIQIELALINTGSEPMPGGIGWHPYFSAGLEEGVTCDATTEWSRAAAFAGLVPTARREALQYPSAPFTLHLSRWPCATISLRSGARIELVADASLPHLVLHRTPKYVCMEPVSHVAGAFGFSRDVQHERGLATLYPGQGLLGRLSVTVIS